MPHRARTFAAAALLLAAAAGLVAARTGAARASGEVQDPQGAVERAFLEQGIRLDLANGRVAIPVEVCIRREPLEYLLVGPYGAAHESLLATGVVPSLLNTALVALGAEPGENARWYEKDPLPSERELADGVSPYAVEPPSGDAFYMYVAWREDGETYFQRVEDLISNLRTGRSLRRHGWVYLGSRMVRPRPDDAEEVFAADVEGNLINLSFFRAGNTLMTAALDDCVYQTIWVPNEFLVPERGTPMQMLFCREPLEALPADLARLLFGAGGDGEESGD